MNEWCDGMIGFEFVFCWCVNLVFVIGVDNFLGLMCCGIYLLVFVEFGFENCFFFVEVVVIGIIWFLRISFCVEFDDIVVVVIDIYVELCVEDVLVNVIDNVGGDFFVVFVWLIWMVGSCVDDVGCF